jgi:putative restriction endonuclease
MARFWWVNHRQTVRQEIAGGFLWSPKAEANGSRSQFYENMRLARPGEIVLSFAGGAVAYVGRVTDCAITQAKPSAFGDAGAYWDKEGWLLPVIWTDLSPAIRPKDILPALASLLPTKYSPLHPESGRGNQKAYLCEVSVEVVKVILESAQSTLDHVVQALPNPPTISHWLSEAEGTAVAAIEADVTLDSTERRQLLKARVGQGLFRENVSRVERGCRLTGIENPSLLVASHIKPWRLCVSASERLDRYNGLLLTPHADHLFDRGFITFTDAGDVCVSSILSSHEIAQLGLAGAFGRNCGSFAEGQKNYLRYHRSAVFLP